MKRILLDTNIYISAILFGGKLKEIIELARNEKIELLISEYILWEIRKILKYKFKIPDSRLNIIERDILALSKIVEVSSVVDLVTEHPADNLIVACAIDGKADVLITGDKHILILKKQGNIHILTAYQFLTKIE
ncbi:putative toxin-antitoxin system toxin component, PIN family [Candidatus Saganbacteria bacterium]|nr:putative toxin-antitoxin system toxin component, PIN family [Candidatus Saganbacteria bacterium]